MLFFKLKDKEKELESHLLDIRKHLIFAIIVFFITFIIVFYFSKDIYNLLTKPLLKVLQDYNYSSPFIVTSLPEGFFSYIKITFFTTALIFMPVFLWQVLFYILPIVGKKIRKELIIMGGIIAPLLFGLGALFAYFFTFHAVWNFLVAFNLSRNLELYLKVSEYLSLALSIMFWFGISFELPVVLYIFFKLNIVDYNSLKKFRKIFILLSFIIAALITPPDPFSQIIMALLLIFLYETSLFIIKKSANK